MLLVAVAVLVDVIDSLSGSEKMLLLKVMLSCGPQTLAISSIAQLNVQWSMTMLLTGFAVAALDLERIAVLRIRTVRIVAGAHADVLHQDVEPGCATQRHGS